MLLINHLKKIPDARRGQGRMYDLPHIILFTILAISSGADSYRNVAIFIKENLKTLKEAFNTDWKKAPSYDGIRKILIGINEKELEKAFRSFSRELVSLGNTYSFTGLDGKALRGSYDHIADTTMLQLLSAFQITDGIILAHEKVKKDKKNEIICVNTLMKKLKLNNVIYTVDALHTQKKRSTRSFS